MNTSPSTRLHYLDATRAFALLLGIVFHASLSFMPVFIGWAVMDVSTSYIAGGFALISHTFRMALFFLIAGFSARWYCTKPAPVIFCNPELCGQACRLLLGGLFSAHCWLAVGLRAGKACAGMWTYLRPSYKGLPPLPTCRMSYLSARTYGFCIT